MQCHHHTGGKALTKTLQQTGREVDFGHQNQRLAAALKGFGYYMKIDFGLAAAGYPVQQEGMRYSARDLAVFRAKNEGVPVLLGSATPSLETYAHAQSGRYARLLLKTRAVRDAALPKVSLIDLNTTPVEEGVVFRSTRLTLGSAASRTARVLSNRRV